MNQKTVGFMHRLTVHPQRSAHGLALLTRVGEDKTLMSTRVVEDIEQARIGC